jgi:2-polyprenyl-3-methyl-5-hydroxy-6-metoxy-1,4-benzoquinol methylase
MNAISEAREPGIRAAPRPQCYSCGGAGVALYDELRDELFSAPGSWALRRCEHASCGLLWLDPMPLADDLARAYEDYYTHDTSAGSRGRNAVKAVYRLLVDAFLWPLGIPAERRRTDLMLIGGRPPGTVLDIGCGHGVFLAQLAMRGWRVSGIDFDPVAVAAARAQHLDVEVGTVDTLVDSGRTFDYVTASHVVEHVPDPVHFLAQCRRLLKPGGSAIVRTPNANSLGHRRYGRAWRGLEPPRHLHIFTPAAFVACARRAGFANSQCFTSAVAAEGILIASHFLKRGHAFRPQELSGLEVLESKALAPLLASWAKVSWFFDRSCGEEIYAVLQRDDQVGQ